MFLSDSIPPCQWWQGSADTLFINADGQVIVWFTNTQKDKPKIRPMFPDKATLMLSFHPIRFTSDSAPFFSPEGTNPSRQGASGRQDPLPKHALGLYLITTGI